MSLKPCRWIKGEILKEAHKAGAVGVGCAAADLVDESVRREYMRWLATGSHGTMGYMAANVEVRFDPRRLLPGAKTVISMAFPYRPPGGYHHRLIADYALGKDYHRVLKERLSRVGRFISDNYGAQTRVCVDTAPILERYWAQKSGVGFIGQNRQLIVPGAGSEIFLAEIVTTLALESDRPLQNGCDGCGMCIRQCPGQAISADGFDARKCHSYLTIEYRGSFSDGLNLGQRAYGCDMCQSLCPHNKGVAVEPLEEFYPDARLLKLDAETIANMTGGEWRRFTAESAMSRITLRQMLRNLNHIAGR